MSLRCGDCGKLLADQFELTWHQRDECPKTQGNIFDAVGEQLAELDLAPGRTRNPDYSTSEAGARSVAYRAGSQKAKLMDAYRMAAPGGLTDEEAAKLAGLPSMSCWWKRSNELRQAGLIVPTGEERPGDAGVPRIVCRATDGKENG